MSRRTASRGRPAARAPRSGRRARGALRPARTGRGRGTCARRRRARRPGSRARARRRFHHSVLRPESAARCPARRRAGLRRRAARAAAAACRRPGRRPRDGRLRHVADRVRQDERALHHLPRRDAVRDVDDLRLGGDRLDHAVAGADEVVGSPKSVRKVMNKTLSLARGDEPVKVVRRPPRPTTSRPAASAASVVWGPIETAGMSSRAPRRPAQPSRTRARRGRPRAAPTAELVRPVERDEVGAELVGEQRARSLRRGDEDAARPAVAAPRAALPASRLPGRRTASRPCATSVSAVAGPIAASCGVVAA